MIACIFFGVLVAAVGARAPCCSPNVWEGVLYAASGWEAEERTHFAQNLDNVHYDYNLKKWAIRHRIFYEDDSEATFTIIGDHTTEKMYVVAADECTESALSGEMRQECIPEGAVSAGTRYYGIGNSRLQCSVFHLDTHVEEQLTRHQKIVVTEELCIPVFHGSISFTGNAPGMRSVALGDVIPEISDRTVFDPPPECVTRSYDEVIDKIREIGALDTVQHFFLGETK